MSMNISIETHPSYLLVVVQGEFDYTLAVDLFNVILSSCRLHKLSNILIDYRNLKGDIRMSERYMYADSITEKIRQYIDMGGTPLRIAYLGSKEMVRDDDLGVKLAAEYDFINVIVTTSATEAYQCLGIDSQHVS